MTNGKQQRNNVITKVLYARTINCRHQGNITPKAILYNLKLSDTGRNRGDKK